MVVANSKQGLLAWKDVEMPGRMLYATISLKEALNGRRLRGEGGGTVIRAYEMEAGLVASMGW